MDSVGGYFWDYRKYRGFAFCFGFGTEVCSVSLNDLPVQERDTERTMCLGLGNELHVFNPPSQNGSFVVSIKRFFIYLFILEVIISTKILDPRRL